MLLRYSFFLFPSLYLEIRILKYEKVKKKQKKTDFHICPDWLLDTVFSINVSFSFTYRE